MPRFVAVIAAWLGLITSTVAQADSPMGLFLAPWAGHHAQPIAVTSDGTVIVFVESSNWCNQGDQERLSVIRSDGTGYRVVLDVAELTAIKPFPGAENRIEQLVMSGDGRRAAFWWAGLYQQASCASSGAPRWFLLDLEQESVAPLVHDGKDVGSVSLTDDASRMVFKGWNESLGAWRWFVADGDGRNAVPFLDPSGWLTTFGLVSGDGSRFLMVGYHGAFPFPSDVYLYEFATEAFTKLSPTTQDNIFGAHLSYDGDRVVYGGPFFKLCAIQADGSGYHEISTPVTTGSTATISRDGEHLFFGHNQPTFNSPGECYRISWEGQNAVRVSDLWNPIWDMSQLPINANGSTLVHWSRSVAQAPPLTITTLSPPMLTTYGYGVAGTPLTWDVLGESNDTFVLAWALDSASLPIRYGTLELDPASLQILWAGAIEGTDNAASLTLTLPPGVASLPEAVPVHFQALVLGAGDGKLTNATVVSIGPASAAARAGAEGPWAGGVRAAANSRATAGGWPSGWDSPRAETPEERWEQLVRTDPALWEAVHGELPRR